MKLNSVLCLLLLASNTEAAFWNKNGKNDGGNDNRRRLTEVPTSSMDVDAATGTVTHAVSEEQENARKAAQSCDGQMAQSLVNANENMMNAQAERDEMKNQKAQALEQVAALQKSLSEMEEVNKQLEQKVEATIQEKDAKVKSMMGDLESSQGELVSQIKVLETKIVENAKAADATLAASLKETEDKYAGEMAKLKKLIAAQKEEAAEALAIQERAAQATMKAELYVKKQEVKAAMEQVKKAEQDAKESEEELAMWRATHQNRTYCNYTYLTEDIYWARSKAYNKSADLTYNAYDSAASLAAKATEKSYVAMEEAKVYADKGQKKVKPHYDKHLKPHVEKHINPLVAKGYEVYEKNVVPKLKEIKSKVGPKVEQVQTAYLKQFNKLARKYATACDKAYKATDKMAKKNGLKEFDNYIAPFWKASCENPKDTLRGAQYAVLFALLLPYTFGILRFMLWLVLLPLRIFIAITPLRFFFYYKPRKTTPTTTTKTASGVKVKSKKGRINSSQ